MLNRVTSLLIGKDISRDTDVIAGAQLDTIMKSTGLAEGEIVVLDKDMKVLTAGSTVADSDTIYIVQATGHTFDYTNKAGSAVVGNRKIKMSAPIMGSYVKKYSGKAYSAKSEQTASLTLTGLTPALATEYIVRIVYKDVNEHPGQFTQTYRYIATAADVASVDTFGANIVAKINAHSGRRVTASYSSPTLTLTGREIASCTSTVNDIDKYSQVEFDVFFNYVDSSGDWQVWPSTSTTVTYSAAAKGSGEWEEIRDLEKSVLGYRGIWNTTHFPVIKPDVETVLNETYDMLVIEHDTPYQSPDNQYVKQTAHTTVLAIPNTSTSNQMDSILAQLNPWMASCPGAFSSVSF